MTYRNQSTDLLWKSMVWSWKSQDALYLSYTEFCSYMLLNRIHFCFLSGFSFHEYSRFIGQQVTSSSSTPRIAGSRTRTENIERLIFVIFKELSSLPMLTQSTIIFCLWFINYGCFTPSLLFPYHICLVSVMICIFIHFQYMYFQFTRRLRIALVFAILTISPFISKSLLVNTPVTMAILQKCLGTFLS